MNVALRIVSLALLWLSATARAEDLLVLECAPTDHAASERLRELHDEPTQVLEDAEARDPAYALAQGRTLDARRVVVFDGPHVSLFDTQSGEQVTRTTEDNTAYTAAFVAAELLALRPAPPLPPPTIRFGVRLGAQLMVAPPFPAAARVELGLALQSRLLRAELYAAAPGRSSHAEVERTRNDVGLRGAWFALTRERFRLAVAAQVGGTFTSARLAQTGPAHKRSAFSAGLGLEPSLTLTPWLSLYGLAIVQGSTPRAEYRVAGEQAARESPVGASVSLGLWLTPPFR